MNEQEIQQLALIEYPEQWVRDIDGDSYDANRRNRMAFIKGCHVVLNKINYTKNLP